MGTLSLTFTSLHCIYNIDLTDLLSTLSQNTTRPGRFAGPENGSAPGSHHRVPAVRQKQRTFGTTWRTAEREPALPAAQSHQGDHQTQRGHGPD